MTSNSPTEPQHASALAQKKQLRKKIRAQRRQLSLRAQKAASQALINRLKKSGFLLRGEHTALYLGNDGEICPAILSKYLAAWGKKAYLPVIHPLQSKRMVFCRIDKNTQYQINRFGIKEPVFKRSIQLSPKRLSNVLMPLVAFDQKGNRMGMGGGFYDRAFSYKHDKPQALPRLIGLAHEFQKQTDLPLNEWDVKLDAIVTDKQIYAD